MIINHEFVENELTPEMVLGLEPSLSSKKTSCLALIAMQIFYLDVQNRDRKSLLNWEISNLLHQPLFRLLLMCPMPRMSSVHLALNHGELIYNQNCETYDECQVVQHGRML